MRHGVIRSRDVWQPNRNHMLGNVKRAPARVSEHPFGTIKWYDGAHYFLCKGKEKVAAEASLMFLSYDIRRAITFAGGVQKLIHRMSEALARMKGQGITLPI